MSNLAPGSFYSWHRAHGGSHATLCDRCYDMVDLRKLDDEGICPQCRLDDETETEIELKCAA